jgi:hypothetical protein
MRPEGAVAAITPAPAARKAAIPSRSQRLRIPRRLRTAPLTAGTVAVAIRTRVTWM